MRPFVYTSSPSVSDAVAAIASDRPPLAGGTDLLPLLKADIRSAATLVDIKSCDLADGIGASGQGAWIGALTTLSEIADSPLLAQQYPLLVQAARHTATTQIRNRATLGGNLLQRPRCWYFRNPRSACWLKGGDECLALEGRNEQHALFGASPCRAAHPSDLAGCLLALDASVTLRGRRGTRRLALADFFAEPQAERRRETVIREDELVDAVDFPALDEDWRSRYLKAMDRKVWAFALAGVAIVLKREGGKVEQARLVANGVAPVPWRLRASEACLTGGDGGTAAIEAAVDAASEDAQPLSGNAYKVDLLRRLLRKGLRETLEGK